jgi:hypothetical protein
MTAVEHRSEQFSQPQLDVWYEGEISKEDKTIKVLSTFDDPKCIYNLNLTLLPDKTSLYSVLKNHVSQHTPKKVSLMFSKSELESQNEVFNLEINIVESNGDITKCMCSGIKYSSII